MLSVAFEPTNVAVQRVDLFLNVYEREKNTGTLFKDHIQIIMYSKYSIS